MTSNEVGKGWNCCKMCSVRDAETCADCDPYTKNQYYESSDSEEEHVSFGTCYDPLVTICINCKWCLMVPSAAGGRCKHEDSLVILPDSYFHGYKNIEMPYCMDINPDGKCRQYERLKSCLSCKWFKDNGFESGGSDVRYTCKHPDVTSNNSCGKLNMEDNCENYEHNNGQM